MKKEGYFLEVNVHYLEKLHELYNDLPFLSEGMKIEKVEQLVANLHDKTEYVIPIRNLKEALNHELVLKPYINMNTDLRKKGKNYFENFFFKLMNNACFGKTMKNVRKYRDVKLVATERTRNYLV